nr:hypothetical protein [aff. Roholtiella sp. LEGE 12411]
IGFTQTAHSGKIINIGTRTSIRGSHDEYQHLGDLQIKCLGTAAIA